MITMKAEPIAGPGAWLGADVARSREWTRTVSAVVAVEKRLDGLGRHVAVQAASLRDMAEGIDMDPT